MPRQTKAETFGAFRGSEVMSAAFGARLEPHGHSGGFYGEAVNHPIASSRPFTMLLEANRTENFRLQFLATRSATASPYVLLGSEM